MKLMQLLVSVTSETEVAAALQGGADIIDIKNPREGALGANFPHVIQRVRECTPLAVPVSAAIGDVPNLPGTVALAALGAATCGVQYVKVGLLGPQTAQDALILLQQVCRAVRDARPDVQIIATAYADAHKVNALPPLALPAVARQAGVDGCLLDTAKKGEGTLLTHLSKEQLYTFVAQCQGADLICALAGSLGAQDIPRICQLGPDILGVRTAACQGGRVKGRVDADKVRHLKALIAAHASPASRPSATTLPVVPAAPR
jgi:(5-formylfuran-3-yl)methyl phosphate synthase